METADASVQIVSYRSYINKISCVTHIVKVSECMKKNLLNFTAFNLFPMLGGLVQHQRFSMCEYQVVDGLVRLGFNEFNHHFLAYIICEN